MMKKALTARDILEQNMNNYISDNFSVCSDRCFKSFTHARFGVNDERCMVNCFNLRNHFWFETHNALNDYLRVTEDPAK